MSASSDARSTSRPSIPADDMGRRSTITDADAAEALHLGIAGDTYTILLSGRDTAGRLSLIDMYVPPGGGPPSHRHDFEETFVLLEGELETTLRGEKRTVRAGETIHIPANAPHQFHNSSSAPVRMLCICSPSGSEEFFQEVGTRVATRTTPPPRLDAAEEAAGLKKILDLAPKYGIEVLVDPGSK